MFITLIMIHTLLIVTLVLFAEIVNIIIYGKQVDRAVRSLVSKSAGQNMHDINMKWFCQCNTFNVNQTHPTTHLPIPALS